MSHLRKEVCVLLESRESKMTWTETLEFTIWQAVTWTENEADGMIVIAEEKTLSKHGSRSYVRLMERLLNDGWEPLIGVPNSGTLVRPRR